MDWFCRIIADAPAEAERAVDGIRGERGALDAQEMGANGDDYALVYEALQRYAWLWHIVRDHPWLSADVLIGGSVAMLALLWLVLRAACPARHRYAPVPGAEEEAVEDRTNAGAQGTSRTPLMTQSLSADRTNAGAQGPHMLRVDVEADRRQRQTSRQNGNGARGPHHRLRDGAGNTLLH